MITGWLEAFPVIEEDMVGLVKVTDLKEKLLKVTFLEVESEYHGE